MSDHLFDQSILDLLLHNPALDELNLAIDRKVDSIFDSDDAMKVQTRGDRILEIGKDLVNYDAIDTGFFVCPLNIFNHLERAKRDGDCSLADGVRSMALEGKARAVDIGSAWWQDIDGNGTADVPTQGNGNDFFNDPNAVSGLFLYNYKKIKRGYLGRTPDIVTFDVNFSYPIKFGEKSQLNLALAIFNLFNNQEARTFDDNVESIAGIADPDFLTPNDFGPPRTMRLSVNWSF
jgi:hypothetical protein